MTRSRRVVCAALVSCIAPLVSAAITIGPGPWIGTDSAGQSFNQEFQDWAHADVRALDGAGVSVGGRYNFNDGYDDSRDLIAFYHRIEADTVFMRVDLYDLKLGAENGFFDLYVAIDCAPGGQPWLPDFTDVQTDRPWEVCVNLYDTANRAVINQNFQPAGGFVGSYFNSQLDAIEFAITRQTLINNGWDGSRVLYFTVFTTKDGTNGGAGEISGGAGSTSDAADCFYDDDRGFADGVINGGVPSNWNVGRAKYASIAHGNQSINQADDLRVHIFDPPTFNKTGFIRTLETHQIFNVPVNLHLSGTLIAAARWARAAPGDDPRTDGPAFLARVAGFVNLDQSDGKPGALIGGVFAEHIMPYFEGPVNAKSIEQFNDLMLDAFGLSPADVPVMHTPERVIRSQPTNLAPLDGFTFQDIEDSSYAATYLDEVTHLHWWFYPADAWSGANGSFDAPRHHKIHKINGVYTFSINDREDQAKFGPHDGGMNRDTRFTLLDKAQQADQAQLTLVFDDWEALAGKSFDPGQGQSVENNNQSQYQQTIRWAANHPWIEIVTLPEILARATNTSHPQFDAAWVVDQGYRFDLQMETYEWLKHASENSYNYWYYNSNAGFGGNEQNFYDLVPVISGEQGDYHRRFGFPVTSDAQANALDGPKLPSGRKHGDLNTPGSLMYESWAKIAAAPDNALRRVAEFVFTTMIYETAWHEEDYGATQHYQGTNFGNPWPVPDPTWDGVNTWALKLQNHVRSVGFITAGAGWAEAVRLGVVGPETIVLDNADLDLDGLAEYVLYNSRVYAAFERRGGRLVHAFAWVDALDDAVQVLGAPLVNPSEPGEEERIGGGSNRCSTFKDMNAAYVDAEFSASAVANGFTFASPDGKIVKTIRLPDGGATLDASYSNATGATHFARVGASPNVLDLVFSGRDNLLTSSTSTYYQVRNLQGGLVRVYRGSSTFNSAPADAGFENRNLALAEQIEVSGGAAFGFGVQIGTGMFDADYDADVDAADLAAFGLCLNGPGNPPSGGCTTPMRITDWDGDGDLDLLDLAACQASATGAQ